MKHNLTCKYCGDTFTVRCKPEDLRWYLRCCKPCFEDDAPGMARFNKMAATMSPEWALNHSAPR